MFHVKSSEIGSHAMSDRDIVITRSAELERLLDRLGGRGTGLGQKAISLDDRLPAETNATLKYICGVRNKAAHEVSFTLYRPNEFLQACDRAKSGLQAMALPPPQRKVSSADDLPTGGHRPRPAARPNPISAKFSAKSSNIASHNPLTAIATNMLAAFGYLLKFSAKFTATFILSCLGLVIGIVGIILLIALVMIYLQAAIDLLVRLGNPNLYVTPGLLTATIQPIAICYLAASLVTIYYYRRDKQAAIDDTWRTPEKRLHQLELLGGWIGAFIAQQIFRHKTTKTSFQLTFNLIVIFHLALLGNLFLFQGKFWWVSLVILGVVLFNINQSQPAPVPPASKPKIKIRHQQLHR
jgi:uncharacterized membrane protein YsdA (DUF1294 family)